MEKIKIIIFLVFLIFITFYLNTLANQKLTSNVLIIPTKIYPSYIKTPQDINDWLMKEGFKYISDKTRGDEWKTPEHTIKDKGGDCEDFAILAENILENLGYDNVMVIAIYGEGLAHGICWFQEKDGTWGFFSSGMDLKGNSQFYFPCKVKNPLNILYRYFPEWPRMVVCTSDGYSIFRINRCELERRQP